jgi:hypothetical protein
MNAYYLKFQPVSELPRFWQAHCSILRSSRKQVAAGEPMPGKNIPAFGIHPHRASFEYAHRALRDAGFGDVDISVLLQENTGSKAKQLLSSTGAEDISSTSESAADYDSANRTGRRAALG